MASALTIAGSDSGGGAGIQADLKTFEAHGVFGLSAITALTAQNSLGVEAVMGVPPDMVRAQCEAVIRDFAPKAAKTGMLFDEGIIDAVADVLQVHPMFLVSDPVMVATSGDRLLKPEAERALREKLLPMAQIITPNAEEAKVLAGRPIEDEGGALRAAEAIAASYPQAWILLKGAHLHRKGATTITDLLYKRGESPIFLETEWIDTPHTHGTGCTLSAAITANIVQGRDVVDSVKQAKSYISGAIRRAWSGEGKGRGSLRHNYRNTGYED